MNRTKPPRSLVFLLIIFLMQATLTSYAQDTEPTERPFPGQSQSVEPTNRPFPDQNTPSANVDSTNSPIATTEDTAPALVGDDFVLTVDNALATAAAAEQTVTVLQADVERLTTELEASQADNGATTFAVVIIVVGILLALAVFFGLRRIGT